MKPHQRAGLLGVAFLVLPSVVLGAATKGSDPFLLEEQVSTATLRSQALSEVPASVTVITRQEIQDHAFETLAEALSSVRGFFVTGDHNYAYAGMRGFDPLGDWGTHLLIMIDGYPMVGSVYFDAPLDAEFPVDMSAVERIEVTRGPGSALYGTNAVLGVVNVITRREPSPKSSLRVEGGSDNTSRSVFEAGGRLGAWTGYLNAAGFGGRGPDYFIPGGGDPFFAGGWVRGADANRGGRLCLSAVRPNWTIKAAGSSRTKEVGTGAYGTVLGDDRTRTRDGWWFAEVEHVQSLGSDAAVQARLAASGANYSGDYLYAGEEPGDPPTLSQEESTGRVVDLDVRGHFKPGRTTWTTLGASAQRSLRAHYLGWDNDPYVVTVRLNEPFWHQSVYGQTEWRPVPVASTQIGLRLDDYSNSATTLSPRLGLTLRPGRLWTARALVGRAFREPNIYELRYTDDYSTKANPDLRPEVAWSYEAGVESHPGPWLSVTLTAFANSLDDRISLTLDPVDSMLVYRNVGSLRIHGLEAEASGLTGAGLRWRLSYALAVPDADGASAAGGENVPNFARHVGQVAVTAPLPLRNGRASMLIRAIGPRVNYREEAVPGSAVADLAASIDPVPDRLHLTVKMRNIFDVSCPDPSSEEVEAVSLPGPGRTLLVRAQIDF